MNAIILKSLLIVLTCLLPATALATPTPYSTLGEITSVIGSNPWGVGINDQVTISGSYFRDGEPTLSYTTYVLDYNQPTEIDFLSFGAPGSVEFSGTAYGTGNFYNGGSPESSFLAGINSYGSIATAMGWRFVSYGGAFSISDGNSGAEIQGAWIGPASSSQSVPVPPAALLVLSGLVLIQLTGGMRHRAS
ncbi:MAG: hypothetical protein ACFHX7_23770 [Pseudomonadota bacterium]